MFKFRGKWISDKYLDPDAPDIHSGSEKLLHESLDIDKAIQDAFNGSVHQEKGEPDPFLDREVEEAFGSPEKGSEISSDIDQAVDEAFNGSVRDKPRPPASGGPVDSLINEIFGVKVSDEELLFESVSLLCEEAGNGDLKISGVLLKGDERTKNGKKYPLSTLVKAVREKVWRGAKIFFKHSSRIKGSLKKLIGRINKMWIDGGFLRFEALLKGSSVDQVAGLRQGLLSNLIDISLAGSGRVVKDGSGERVVRLSSMSLDLLGSETPASPSAKIQNVVQV